jgi:hypothetical protein
MTIQAEGNYKEAQEMIEKLAVVRPEVRVLLDRLTEIPIDIRPIYSTAEQLVKALP